MDALALADRDLQIEAMSSELSDNTRKAYQKGWSRFTDYCVCRGDWRSSIGSSR